MPKRSSVRNTCRKERLFERLMLGKIEAEDKGMTEDEMAGAGTRFLLDMSLGNSDGDGQSAHAAVHVSIDTYLSTRTTAAL